MTAVMLLGLSVATVRAVELDPSGSWPHWRGVRDDGAATGRYPSGWQDGSLIAWKAKLPGSGCSTPVIVRDRIFVTCPAEGRNALLAFDWQGKEVWRTQLGPERAGKHRNGSGSNPSPVTDGTAVFAHFKSGNLAAFSMDGKLRWKTNLLER